MSNQYQCECGERKIKIVNRTKFCKCPECGRRMTEYDKRSKPVARLIVFFNDGIEYE